MGACRIGIPAHPLVSCTQTFGNTDCSVIIHTEVHCLTFRTPVQGRVCAGIRVQECTVLDHTPLGIDCNTAPRHCSEIVLLGACIINKPTFQNITFCGRHIVIITIFIIRCYICTVCNILRIMQMSLICFIHFISITIHIYTIHKVNGVFFASVIEIYSLIISSIPYIICCIIVRFN